MRKRSSDSIEEMSTTRSELSPRHGGVTWRAVALSMVIVAVTAPAIFYGEVVFASRNWNIFWSSGVPAPWPLTVLFLLTALTSIPAFRRLRFTRPELLTVYSIILVVTPLFGIHVLFYVLSKGPSFYHMARVEPMWGSAFVNLIPTWWGPSSLSAVEGYFWGGAAVPWSEWSLPLAAWGAFMLALFLANVCLLALVQHSSSPMSVSSPWCSSNGSGMSG